MPVVISETSNIYDAIVTLFTEDTGTIYVVDNDNYLTGVVSRKDFLKTTLGRTDLFKVPVSVIMTRMPNVVTCNPEDKVVDAAKRL